jgi:hypothetical protein
MRYWRLYFVRGKVISNKRAAVLLAAVYVAIKICVEGEGEQVKNEDRKE